MQVTSIVNSVRSTLLDNFAGVKSYSDEELLEYINDASTWILNGDPSANPITKSIPLVSGIHQHAGEDVIRLLDVWNNEGTGVSVIDGLTYSGGCPVRYVDVATYRYSMQDWNAHAANKLALNVVFNDNDPAHFIVFPPNDGNGSLIATVSVVPPKVTSISSLLEMPDTYKEAYTFYVLFKALSRDGEDQSNAASASAYFALADKAIQSRLIANIAAKPDTETKK